MREDTYRDPVPGAGYNGISRSELSLEPPPFEPASDDLGLTLARDPAEPPPKRRRPLPRRPLILAGWAVVLGVALSIAYVTQPSRQLTGDADQPPAIAPAAADELGAPVTAPSIADQPDRFAQASSAPEINPPALDEPQPGDLQIADAAPPSAPAPTKAAALEAAPSPPVAKAAVVETTPDKPKPAAKLEKVSARDRTDPAAKDDAKPLKKDAKALKKDAKALKKAEKIETAAHAPKMANAKDIPQLKARLNRAYAEAVKAGTSKAVLKARQAEWQVLRAKAEKEGPTAVAALYRTRAAQLEAIAKKTARNRSRAEAAPV